MHNSRSRRLRRSCCRGHVYFRRFLQLVVELVQLTSLWSISRPILQIRRQIRLVRFPIGLFTFWLFLTSQSLSCRRILQLFNLPLNSSIWHHVRQTCRRTRGFAVEFVKCPFDSSILVLNSSFFDRNSQVFRRIRQPCRLHHWISSVFHLTLGKLTVILVRQALVNCYDTHADLQG